MTSRIGPNWKTLLSIQVVEKKTTPLKKKSVIETSKAPPVFATGPESAAESKTLSARRASMASTTEAARKGSAVLVDKTPVVEKKTVEKEVKVWIFENKQQILSSFLHSP